jgi:hypothetical protein
METGICGSTVRSRKGEDREDQENGDNGPKQAQGMRELRLFSMDYESYNCGEEKRHAVPKSTEKKTLRISTTLSNSANSRYCDKHFLNIM